MRARADARRDAALLLILLAICWVPSDAGSSERHTLFRWGVGWDEGLAVRYMVDSSWGLGLRIDALGVRPGSVRDDEQPPLEDGVSVGPLYVGALIFREAHVGTWLRIGPFASVAFRHQGPTFNGLYTSFGLRPAVVWRQRFVLETRFGMMLEYRHSLRDWCECRRCASYTSDVWDLHAFGSDLGPHSTLRFIFMF